MSPSFKLPKIPYTLWHFGCGGKKDSVVFINIKQLRKFAHWFRDFTFEFLEFIKRAILKSPTNSIKYKVHQTSCSTHRFSDVQEQTTDHIRFEQGTDLVSACRIVVVILKASIGF